MTRVHVYKSPRGPWVMECSNGGGPLWAGAYKSHAKAVTAAHEHVAYYHHHQPKGATA